jgi:hypothetical protein
LPGYLRHLASESLDGFGCRDYSIDRAIIARAIAASVGRFGLRALLKLRHFIPLNSLKYSSK